MKTTSSIVAAACLLLSSPSLTLAQSCTVTSNTKITFFGWPDNGPPKGPDDAFDCGRGNGPDGQPIAGGTRPPFIPSIPMKNHQCQPP